jgi:predicted membrane protein
MILLFACWFSELRRWYRFGRSHASRWVGNAMTLVPWFAFLIAWLYYIVTRDVDVIVPLSKKLLWHLSNYLPANLLAVAIIVALPILGMYALLEWQFARSESIPTARITK